ncbi:MAG TPA: pantetheine-phosphate adenylyltransferase [Actinomycetota bacterium]|nr:pantetheine-phosphate adenylyltransferase [Actinomycetota bacterium]
MGLAALCPGTFDPVTNGHLDIIERAASVFDPLVVAVLENPGKEPVFGVEDRLGMLKEALADLPAVEVAAFSGLLVDVAKDRGIGVIVKGVRAVSDFDYELQMSQMNRHLAGVETVFVPTSPEWSYLSSTLIKEVVRFGGDASGLVPGFVLDRLKERLAPGRSE